MGERGEKKENLSALRLRHATAYSRRMLRCEATCMTSFLLQRDDPSPARDGLHGVPEEVPYIARKYGANSADRCFGLGCRTSVSWACVCVLRTVPASCRARSNCVDCLLLDQRHPPLWLCLVERHLEVYLSRWMELGLSQGNNFSKVMCVVYSDLIQRMC